MGAPLGSCFTSHSSVCGTVAGLLAALASLRFMTSVRRANNATRRGPVGSGTTSLDVKLLARVAGNREHNPSSQGKFFLP